MPILYIKVATKVTINGDYFFGILMSCSAQCLVTLVSSVVDWYEV